MILQWALNGQIDLQQIANEFEHLRLNNEFVNNWEKIVPGMYLHNNGKIGASYIKDVTLAVVLQVDYDKHEVLLMSLTGKVLPFSAQGFSFDTLGLFSGLNATHLLAQIAEDCAMTVEAATYCLQYANVYISQGVAFLPTEDEVKELFPYATQISEALRNAHVSARRFWTSTTSINNSPSEAPADRVQVFSLEQNTITFASEQCVSPSAVVTNIRAR